MFRLFCDVHKILIVGVTSPNLLYKGDYVYTKKENQ